MTTYVVQINDAFHIEADNPNEAEKKLLEMIGEEIEPNSATVIDVLPDKD